MLPSFVPAHRPFARERRITIGYVPLTDCAPLIVAHELGLFERHGLDVRLSREAGWASVREKMLHAELDAAHAPASMVLEMSLGLGVPAVPSLAGLVMAHHGNAIVLSPGLHALGVHDAASLRRVVEARRGGRPLVFAGVLKYSSQNYIMRSWLRAGGIDPDHDVDMAVVPPPLVADCMEQGHIDGYCVAEPWGSVGLLRGIGHGVGLSADLAPGHPEKIFMVRAAFERDRTEEHRRLLAALIEAGRWCDQPSNRAGLATLLSAPHYLGVPVNALRNALIGPYRLGPDRTTAADRAILFHHNGASRPSVTQARWILDELRRHGLDAGVPDLTDADLAAYYRADLYDAALRLAPASPPPSSVAPSVIPHPRRGRALPVPV
jgi:ABC-type nitrate/sulfonate/bicarbonate transport system substrate-binding protein